jgi:RNA polymerase sigma-70 factor (ECF subfamily)
MTPPFESSSGTAAAPDRAFLQRVRERDGAALERFFDLYYDRVVGHAARLVGDIHLAEDLAHEAFLRIGRAIERLDPDRDPAAWIFTVVTNCIRDHWRSRGHKQAARSTELTGDHLEVIADEGTDAEADLARRQQQQAVRDALATLAEADREVILLHDYEGLEHAAVAEVLGAKTDAIRQRYRRAVARLGEAYRSAMDDQERAGP